MDDQVKTFTIVMNASNAIADMEHEVHARVVTLKMVSILAKDVTGAAGAPIIGVDIGQFSSSVNDNHLNASKILVYTDVSKVHTFYACDVSYTLSGPLYRSIPYKVTDESTGSAAAIDFTNEILRVSLTFEYSSADI